MALPSSASPSNELLNLWVALGAVKSEIDIRNKGGLEECLSFMCGLCSSSISNGLLYEDPIYPYPE